MNSSLQLKAADPLDFLKYRFVFLIARSNLAFQSTAGPGDQPGLDLGTLFWETGICLHSPFRPFGWVHKV